MSKDITPRRVDPRELNKEIQTLERQVKRHPKNFDLYRRLGDRLRDNSEIELAINAYMKALEIKHDKKLAKILDLCKQDLMYRHRSSD